MAQNLDTKFITKNNYVMRSIKRFVFILVLALTSGAYGSNAQIYVNVRPVVPHFVRPVAPSPRHVWIGEEWEPRGGAYVFVGGHWAEPPHGGMVWVSGHWRHTPHGDAWIAGHWR